MMRFLIRTIVVIFLLVAGAVFEGCDAAAMSRPAGNGIVITNLPGAAQATRPFTISRVFVQGEFPSGTYPQASVVLQAD